jgi:hypothetical protein
MIESKATISFEIVVERGQTELPIICESIHQLHFEFGSDSLVNISDERQMQISFAI